MDAGEALKVSKQDRQAVDWGQTKEAARGNLQESPLFGGTEGLFQTPRLGCKESLSFLRGGAKEERTKRGGDAISTSEQSTWRAHRTHCNERVV